MRIQPIIDLLDTGSLLGKVELAQSLTALDDEEIRTGLPLIFIYQAKTAGGENNLMMGGASQQINHRFCLMYAAENAVTPDDYLENVRELAHALIVGKKPFTDGGAIRFIEGEIIDVSKRVIWWMDTFEIPKHKTTLS